MKFCVFPCFPIDLFPLSVCVSVSVCVCVCVCVCADNLSPPLPFFFPVFFFISVRVLSVRARSEERIVINCAIFLRWQWHSKSSLH